jgi:uncharacterized protein (DUF488 family)
MSVSILTIGYADRSLEEMFSLLKREETKFLIDVRSVPVSRFKPEFSRDSLEQSLKSQGIRYVFMGDSLGGRPPDPSCYENGHVIYRLVQERPFFRNGIDRLLSAATDGHRVCLMCSERRPEDCHRSKLIGVALSELGVSVSHIDKQGNLRTQDEVIELLQPSQSGLFELRLQSRKAYRATRTRSGF